MTRDTQRVLDQARARTNQTMSALQSHVRDQTCATGVLPSWLRDTASVSFATEAGQTRFLPVLLDVLRRGRCNRFEPQPMGHS